MYVEGSYIKKDDCFRCQKLQHLCLIRRDNPLLHDICFFQVFICYLSESEVSPQISPALVLGYI